MIEAHTREALGQSSIGPGLFDVLATMMQLSA